MADPTPLSPAAQAVLDAYANRAKRDLHARWVEPAIAAALRAVADQVVPADYDPPRGVSYPEKDAFIDGKCVRNEDIRFQLLAIAAELDGHQPTGESD